MYWIIIATKITKKQVKIFILLKEHFSAVGVKQPTVSLYNKNMHFQ